MFLPETDDGGYIAWTEGVLRNHSLDWCQGTVLNRNLSEHCNQPGFRPYNKYGPGSAALLLPFNLLGLALKNTWGFEPPGVDLFFFWSYVGTFFLFLGGALFLYDTALQLLRERSMAYWTTLLFLFGNSILYYVFRRPLLAHAGEFFLFFLCAWICIRYRVDQHPHGGRSFSLGLFSAWLMVTRLTDFHAVPLFALPVLYGAWREGKKSLFVHLLSFGAGTFLPVFFFLLTNYLQTGAWLYSPSQYDPEFTVGSLFFGHPRNWVRILHFYFGTHWGSFLLMPVLFLECVYLLVHASTPLKWMKERPFLVFPLFLLFAMHLVNMANFPMNGAAYGLRYVLTVNDALHLLFLMVFAVHGFSPFPRKLFLGALVLCALVAAPHYANFESNQSTLTFTWGKLSDEGTVDPKWMDSRQLTSPHYAIHSFQEILRGRAFLNFGASPLVAYPLHIFKPLLRDQFFLQKVWEYYESPKRQIQSGEDLKNLAYYHVCILGLIFSGFLGLFFLKRQFHLFLGNSREAYA